MKLPEGNGIVRFAIQSSQNIKKGENIMTVKILETDAADHMKDFCKEHGLI